MERTMQKRIPVDGDGWVRVDIYGDKTAPCLLIVPGGMSDADAWRGVAGLISAWPSVAVLNRRGRDGSGPLPKNYSLQTELEDVRVVRGELSCHALFGWSLGGLIALMSANEDPVRHVIAYEPVVNPFGQHALPALHDAKAVEDWDRTVEVILDQIAGASAEEINALRANRLVWAEMCRLSIPACSEISALNSFPTPHQLARLADVVDLIIGECDLNLEPYGTSFKAVQGMVHQAQIQELKRQGHLAHLQAPGELASMLDGLARHAAL